MLKRNKHNTGVQSQHKSLSIQFSLDGFSFCITDTASKKISSFTEYIFDVTLPTPKLLSDRVIQLFKQDKDLQYDFDKINVIHQNSLSTLVPNDYFDENKLKNYLDYNIKTLNDDYITFDNLDIIKAKNIYIPFVNVNNYLFQNFGEFEFNHHSTILIEQLLDYKNDEETSFFVNVSIKNIDIVVVKEQQLLLYNSFAYNTKEDFIYYILFVAEQLELNPDKFKLIFLGSIDTESETYKITYDYVRNIDFITPKSDFFNSSDDFCNHAHYIVTS